MHNNLKINKVQKSSIAVLYLSYSISTGIERIMRLRILNVSVMWVDPFISWINCQKQKIIKTHWLSHNNGNSICSLCLPEIAPYPFDPYYRIINEGWWQLHTYLYLLAQLRLRLLFILLLTDSLLHWILNTNTNY